MVVAPLFSPPLLPPSLPPCRSDGAAPALSAPATLRAGGPACCCGKPRAPSPRPRPRSPDPPETLRWREVAGAHSARASRVCVRALRRPRLHSWVGWPGGSQGRRSREARSYSDPAEARTCSRAILLPVGSGSAFGLSHGPFCVLRGLSDSRLLGAAPGSAWRVPVG